MLPVTDFLDQIALEKMKKEIRSFLKLFFANKCVDVTILEKILHQKSNHSKVPLSIQINLCLSFLNLIVYLYQTNFVNTITVIQTDNSIMLTLSR